MSKRRGLLIVVPAVVAALSLVRLPAAGGDPSTSLPEAVKRGEELCKNPWTGGGKACNDCHAGGQNLLNLKRVQTYPKFDKTLGKVVNLQQKLNQMIKDKSGGAPLELGSTDLNALEAYLMTRK